MLLPVGRDTSGGPRCRLVERVGERRGQLGPVVVVLAVVVPEPVLTGLEAPDDGVTRLTSMSTCVLAGRAVAATDHTACGTPPEVEPPPVGLQAFRTAGAARFDRGIDQLVSHILNLPIRTSGLCEYAPAGSSKTPVGPPGQPACGAAASCFREFTPSFANTLCRCHSTVRGLMNSWAAISAFERRLPAR